MALEVFCAQVHGPRGYLDLAKAQRRFVGHQGPQGLVGRLFESP